MSSHFHRLSVADIQRETAEAVTVRFTVPPELREIFRYREGQHLTLRREFDGEELRRNYSICASREDASLRIAVKEIPGGRFSAFINRELRVGDTLEVMPPSGAFHATLDPQARRHHLAFAAGSGITPILSIVKTVLETEAHSRVTLVYGT